jgi:hypothetical protein
LLLLLRGRGKKEEEEEGQESEESEEGDQYDQERGVAMGAA